MRKYNIDRSDDTPIQRRHLHTPFHQILQQRLTRREALKLTGLFSPCALFSDIAHAKLDLKDKDKLTFKEISHGMDDALHVAENYSYQVLLRWGDPIFENTPEFDPKELLTGIKAKQFGYNNDFVAYAPKWFGSNSSINGLLIVNHEYVNSVMMNPGGPKPFDLSKEQINAEIYAVGLSIIEIERQNHNWKANLSSNLNRRITPHSKMKFSGPARGHDRLKTKFAAKYRRVKGAQGKVDECGGDHRAEC